MFDISMSKSPEVSRSAAGRRALFALVCLLGLSGCGIDLPVNGLRPVHPAMKFGNSYSHPAVVEGYTVVSRRNLVFRWEPYTPPADFSSGPVQVSYDLRIWRVLDHDMAELIYRKDGLPDPWHELKGVLNANTRYLWTVRARILADGETRLTAWSRLAGPGCPAGPENIPDDVPVAGFYRFWTNDYGELPSLRDPW